MKRTPFTPEEDRVILETYHSAKAMNLAMRPVMIDLAETMPSHTPDSVYKHALKLANEQKKDKLEEALEYMQEPKVPESPPDESTEQPETPKNDVSEALSIVDRVQALQAQFDHHMAEAGRIAGILSSIERLLQGR